MIEISGPFNIGSSKATHKTLPNGNQVVDFTAASNDSMGRPIWISFEYWGQTAALAEVLKPGKQVFIESAELRAPTTWTGKDGQLHIEQKARVNRLTLGSDPRAYNVRNEEANWQLDQV